MPQTLSIGGSHATRTWTMSFRSDKKTFVFIHFKPFITYSGVVITFNTLISVDGANCSLKSTQISHTINSTLDTTCAFVAEPNRTYELQLSQNNNPSSLSYWVDVGAPLLTYMEI